MFTFARLLALGAATASLLACSQPAPASRSVAPAAGAVAPGAPASAAAPAAQPAPPRQVKVSFAALSSSYMDHYVGIERGFFLEEGLDIERINAGGGVATPALIAGELDFSTSAASALSAMISGAPIKVIYTNLDRPNYQVWSSGPEIKTLSDLVGKQVGVPSRGDTHELAVRLLLRKRGLDPNSVAYQTTGFGAARVAALEAGSVDATTLAPIDMNRFGAMRGNLLGDIEKEVSMVYTGVVAPTDLLAKQPDLVRRFLRGAVKGREFARAHPDITMEIISRYDPAPPETLLADYESNIRTMTPEGWVSEEALRDEIATRAELVGLTAPPPAADLFDYTIIKRVYPELRAAGWQPTP